MRKPATMTTLNKRDFLKATSAFGLGSSLNAFSSFQALAQTAQTDDYRALVCVFMYGGNDSNNMLIPMDASVYSRYAAARTNLALPAGTLLPITPSNVSAKYGLHPAMTGMANLFNGSATQTPKAAVVANVGPLVVPTSKAQWDARSVPLPDNLFSHSDQQNQWQAALYERPGSGWGGRLAERLVDANSTNRGYSVLSVTGGNLWETGDRSLTPYKVSASGNFGFDFYDPRGTDPLSVAITETLATPYSHLFEQGFVDVMGRSIEVQRILTQALEGTNLATSFPNTSLGNQMRMVARLIAARQKLGLKKQCFFCSIGGFDTHGDDQLTRQAELLGDVSQSISAFYAATAELQIQNNVTTFTASDFNRTYTSNGQGSDHAWGAHHLVVGGAVQGGKLFGQFPEPTLQGPLDSGNRGNWIPTTSTEAYAATLGRWFGASPEVLAQVFPRLTHFEPNVGFMG
jgi:uncharacterized protein (DUF1501 family)